MNIEQISKILVELRGQKTQEQVAIDLGISVTAIKMYEAGTRIPRDDIKLKIAEYYDKPIGEIFLPNTIEFSA